MSDNTENDECPICFDTILLPIKTPCGHSFCYMCLKRAEVDKHQLFSCPLCRGEHSLDVILRAKMSIGDLKVDPSSFDALYLYESRSGGWWAFEPRTITELEEAYQRYVLSPNDKTTTIDILGKPCVIDFEAMTQCRDRVTRRIQRKVNDDTSRSVIKGIAGMRIAST